MIATSVIRIEEQETQSAEGQPYTAYVIFNRGERYSCQVRDPFADHKQQEADLEWYFEEYPQFPFTQTVRARTTAESIRTYGEFLFSQIFADPQVLLQYRQATQHGLHTIQLEIAGSSSFHRLHWEALYDPQLGHELALHVPIIRQNLTPQAFAAAMQPSATINILVVVARPAGSRDVGYRTISRPLVEELSKRREPISITLLRPGTYQELQAHLEKATREKGIGYYHVIHFDVHGSLLSYKAFQQKATPSRYLYQGRFGRGDIAPYEGEKAYLFLESERDERADPVEASEVAHLLLTHRIPITILNACQSGKYIDNDETTLGSRLIEAGVQTVLAMGYSVTVSAAELLMPILYRQLLSDTSLSSALCLARQTLANRKERRAFFNQQIELEDWVLPIVYQNQDVRFAVKPMTPEQETAFYKAQAKQYSPPQQPGYGFVGRDVDILHIEKCLLTKRNLLLARGMGGAGKTTLLHHLASWWQRTGLVQQIFYFGYDERSYTRQQIMRAIAKQLLGPEDFALFQSRSPEVQQTQLVKVLYNAPHLIILDNLESITGTAMAIRHTLSKKEQGYLHSFLSALVGGQTRILLGSRSAEDWLAKGTFDDNRYDLPGLDPEAASQLTERILGRHKVTRYREDSDLRKLIKLLDGFPLALEVVLANLVQQTPTQVLTALQAGDIVLKTGESDTRTENILRCIDYSHSNLSLEAQQLLLCLAPFTSVIYLNTLDPYITQLKKQPVLETLPFDRFSDVLQEAINWGLLSPDPAIPQFLRLQPVLPYFLRLRSSSEEQQLQRMAIEKAFQDHYRNLSQQLDALITSKEAKEQQIGLLVTGFEYENLLTALRFALREKASVIDIYNLLDDYLNFQQDHQRGQEIDRQVVQFFETLSEEDLSGSLGKEFFRALVIAANRQVRLKQYESAKKIYQKALQLLEKAELDVKQRRLWQAAAYHNLGRVAQEQRLWQQAEGYYQQALQIEEEYNDRYSQARTYHQLGMIAQEQRLWQQAEDYYQQALQIYVEYNDRYEQASTYHNLGIVAQEQRLWQQAEGYYQQALQIEEEYNDRYSQARTYHHLGIVAQKQRLWQQAEGYYQQALQIKVEYNDRYKQASTYGQLGILAQEQRLWQQAEGYYQQALQIYVEYNDRYEQASTYHNLGIVAQEQRLWQQAEGYYQQALQIYVEYNDRYEQASTYHNLGIVAQEQRLWQQAGELFLQALSIFQEYDDTHNSSIVLNSLAQLWQASNDASILERVASLLKVSQEEVEKLLQELLKTPSKEPKAE